MILETLVGKQTTLSARRAPQLQRKEAEVASKEEEASQEPVAELRWSETLTPRPMHGQLS
jgi:hypothetical protein